MPKHHERAEEKRRGVGEALARDIRRRAVDCFKDCAMLADVSAGSKTKAADQAGTQVAHNIAIEVLGHQNIELFGSSYKLHTTVVDNDVIRLQIRVLSGRL